ncbi:MAG: hypothetical protein N3G74_00310 [Candidatus Micrarchaeota archaeon]|nr:hypothetical protein [Candidatus Micrarchaeota archaeon]
MAKKQTKSNIELRFFLDPSLSKKLSNKWKDEGYKSNCFSYTDFYFRHEKSGKKFAKIRKWRIPKWKPELIFFERKSGIKTETRRKYNSVAEATKHLENIGYEPYLKIDKKKCIKFAKKNKSYFLEYIPGLGWTGEIEFAKNEKQRMKDEIGYLKSQGINRFSLASMLETMEQKLGIKKPKKPKIYKYQLLRI